MSTFIVDDITINRIVSWIEKVAMAGGCNDDFWCIQPLIKLGYKLDFDLGGKRLAEEMFTLNCDSVEQRYGEGQAEEFRPLDFKYQYLGSAITRFQFLKSLRYFLYQCSEGNIPRLNSLFQALDKVSMNLAYQIVSRLPQYENAQWA